MAEDTTGKVENNEQEMIDEGAPVTPQTDPEAKENAETDPGSESDSDSDEEADRQFGNLDSGVPAEKAMISEGAPVSAETEPALLAEEAAKHDSAEEEPVQEADLNAAEHALAGDPADMGDGEYRRRLREYTKELKKLPGDWYIIQSYSGYENKVKTNLDMRIQTLEVEESIYDVVVPIEQAIELKDGKRKLVKRKLLPGYVLVRMDMNDAAWSVVRETPGVTSFVGSEGNATPVKHRDVAKFLMPKEPSILDGDAQKSVVNSDGETVIAMPEEEAAPKLAHDYQVGEAVTILTGALATVSASISEIDPETGKIQALVSIFGRETPVELTADQIERII